jgi:hypothetical protein
MVIAFFILLFLYFLLSKTIGSWITISLLGFDFECPQGFLKHESIYHIVSWVFFLGAFATGILSSLHGGIIFISLAAAWVLSGKLGHSSAFKKYRRNLEEMIADPSTSMDKTELKEMLSLSDRELRAKALSMAKFRKSTRG